MRLDEKGRCCGRKPIEYKNRDYGTDGFKFCPRCDRAFSRQTGEQIANWAYREHRPGIFLCTKHGSVQVTEVK